jgi:hypothetical protein
MLRNPKFYDSPSKARDALKLALQERPVNQSVVDILTRADPEEGKWFGIVCLDTDVVEILNQSRKILPEFRVIGTP